MCREGGRLGGRVEDEIERDILAMEMMVVIVLMMKKSWIVLEEKNIRTRSAVWQMNEVENGGEKQQIQRRGPSHGSLI